MSGYNTFEWVTLGIWIVVITILVYGIVAIHDIPASIARKRNHPNKDAIEAAGWVSLFMLHALWPFLWIWAMTYNPDDEANKGKELKDFEASITELKNRITQLELKES